MSVIPSKLVLASSILVALGAVAAACQSTSDAPAGTAGAGGSAGTGGSAGSDGSAGSGGSGGSTNDGGPAVGTDPTYSPAGCAFQIATRPEYQDWSYGHDDVGATPNVRRVRLGLGGNVDAGSTGHVDPSTSIAMAWETDDGTLASEVTWGDDPDPSKWPAANHAYGPTWLTPVGLNATGPARMHEAYVCGLSPAHTYYYRVGGGAGTKAVWSDVHTFKTTTADAAATVRFAVTGDSRGEQNDAWRVLQTHLMQANVDLQLFSGDMINLAPDQGEWDQWLDKAWKDETGKLSTLGQVLILPAHGNHDNHNAQFYGNLTLPQDVAKHPKYAELFFSVDVGPVHVVLIDDAFIVNPTGDASFKGEFDAWLKADLDAAQANRSTRPWIVAVHHHPEYSSSLHGNDADVKRGRQYFAPIWEQYHVDLVLNGHDHNYERSKPLTGPVDQPTTHSSAADGTIYMICAGSGAEGYGNGTSSFTETSHKYESPEIGVYGILEASPTKLTLTAHTLVADGSDPVLDTLEISK